MEGHISPVSSADEDETEEVIAILQEELKVSYQYTILNLPTLPKNLIGSLGINFG